MDDKHDEYKRTVFVTVGTTSFDSLVKTVDSKQVKEALSAKGYTHLVIQMGRGSYIPKKSSGEDGSLVVDYFTFSSSIADYLRSASLVISHAGISLIKDNPRLKV
ncbi:putative N-acetylglucosaminyldiphosphodolichol N-acetylglucosaminyltransferase [Helianthus annuus]|nr:putative N-acetylglucosaminyldiphosphodolichol N-acetylglucosaminyltransferase [Helianthus annuus]KAJ0658037.1 putative N-acetylglucosaminyldiphosphodolichol N-acetylglucosaminyltransferase [Helianthus annuus]KAJ0661712.1 putative N-acetylglucosaminyldiphosphodolichol N-acetylglucosaminyltransferase [Helianthus annuus]